MTTTSAKPAGPGGNQVAQAAAETIRALWAAHSAPAPGPLRLWEPEHLLDSCGDAVRSLPSSPKGRARTLMTFSVLSAVVGYTRVLLPAHPWTLASSHAGHTAGTPVLWWVNEVTGDVVADIIRAPRTFDALLDRPTLETAVQLVEAGAVTVRAAHLRSPYSTQVLNAGRELGSSEAGYGSKVWAALETPSVVTGTKVEGVA